jgi:DegV family protein with EDD domain
MFKLISDGGCDFSKEETLLYDVTVVPFYVSFDETNHLKEGVDISKEEYFNRLIGEKNLFPKTSQPNPQDYIDAYTPHLEAGNDIISLTISSKLSGSHASAILAADILKEDYPNRRIVVVDSLNVSIAQGLILREMIKMRDAGRSLDEVVELTEKVLQTTKVYFTLNSLEYLKRGGRVGPTTALVGGILGLRPILHLVEGQVEQLDNVRGKSRVLKLMEEAMIAALSDDKESLSLSVGHILSYSEAETFKANAETALDIKIPNPITEVGITIGTHAGPGALAFAYCRKYDALESHP